MLSPGFIIGLIVATAAIEHVSHIGAVTNITQRLLFTPDTMYI